MKEPMQETKLIIFDWDGTLIDSHAYIIDSMLLAARGSGLEEPNRGEVSAIIGMSMLPAIKSLFPKLKDDQVLEFRSIYTEYYNDKNREQPALFEGVFAGLEYLQESYSLAIATGKRKHGLLDGLEQTQSSNFFAALRTADDCASKPSPDMVHSILENMQVKPENAVVVGDNVLDIQMARAANVQAFGVTTGSSTSHEMLNAGAKQCFKQFKELISLF
jgi:phosphoglycolate phosphatase